MRLAKRHIDVGLFTNASAAMLAFWQERVGLPFEETLPLGGGVRQHRHGMHGSVLKINSVREAMEDAPTAGYRTLLIARDRLSTPVDLEDPDGNAVTLVPPGHEGVTRIGLRLAVRDESAFHRFYRDVLQLEAAGERAYRCGDSLLAFAARDDVTAAGPMRARGYRYLTIQVWDVDKEHAAIMLRGGAEGRAPVTLGSTARVSFVRDPDGNWIEISQRASLTGPLPPR